MRNKTVSPLEELAAIDNHLLAGTATLAEEARGQDLVRLFNAAPDLRTALAALVKLSRNYVDGGEIDEMCAWAEATIDAEEALAKVSGHGSTGDPPVVPGDPPGTRRSPVTLFNAAPDLLDALQKCAEALKDHPQYDNPDEPASLVAEADQAARAAIAKAAGKV